MQLKFRTKMFDVIQQHFLAFLLARTGSDGRRTAGVIKCKEGGKKCFPFKITIKEAAKQARATYLSSFLSMFFS